MDERTTDLSQIQSDDGSSKHRDEGIHAQGELERLLRGRPDGAIGPDLFRAACGMGLEGVVSKHRDRPYQAGRSKHWVRVKNRSHPAMEREL
jgi:bifunctional non-homologous end joining protein LigD